MKIKLKQKISIKDPPPGKDVHVIPGATKIAMKDGDKAKSKGAGGGKPKTRKKAEK